MIITLSYFSGTILLFPLSEMTSLWVSFLYQLKVSVNSFILQQAVTLKLTNMKLCCSPEPFLSLLLVLSELEFNLNTEVKVIS